MHSLQVVVWAGLALWPQRASAGGRFCTRIWGFGGGLSRVLTWSGVLSQGEREWGEAFGHQALPPLA